MDDAFCISHRRYAGWISETHSERQIFDQMCPSNNRYTTILLNISEHKQGFQSPQIIFDTEE